MKTKYPPCFVFDIETLPNDLDPVHEALLKHKLRNVSEDKLAIETLKARFIYPVYSRVCSISTLYDPGSGEGSEWVFFDRTNEEKLIRDFIDYLSQWNDRYVHYNGLDFDVPYLLFKCAKYGITPPTNFCNLIRFRTHPHYDLMQVLSAWGKFPISLAEALVSFGITNSKDTLGGLDTLTFLQTASDDAIRKYNLADTQSTYELFKKVYLIYQ
jgi:DNA polymerase elongation subunit (family B)